jgi:DNA-binding YbaB/EbfC family protein
MANPFTQARDLFKMQSEARKMQKEMSSRKYKGESRKGFVKIELNGVGEILDMSIDDMLLSVEHKNDLISLIKDAYKDAQKQMSKDVAKDFDINKLKSLMGM